MAYNSFNGSTDGMGYVYGLTDNGKVFYVGITGFIHFRYKQHFSEMLCFRYIHQMRMKREYPGVIIFGMFKDGDQCEAAEHSLIRYFASIGNQLCNHHQNPANNQIKLPPVNPNDKPVRMPQNLGKRIVDEAINKYLNFRKWQHPALSK